MNSSGLNYQSKEKFNWLSHLNFLKNDYSVCEKINSTFSSDYNNYLMGLIQLRTSGDIKKSLNYLNLIKFKNDITYSKAIIKCIFLAGDHSLVASIIKNEKLKIFPKDWQLWQMYGLSCLHQYNVTLAKEAFQQATQSTNKIDSFFYLSKCHLLEGDVKSAIFILRKATELEPNNIDLTIKLGLLLYKNGMKNKGIEKLNQIRNFSTNIIGDLQLSLAMGSIIQETQNNIDDALFRYKIANTFESPIIWNNVSLCFLQKNKFVAAISCLKRSLYLNIFDWKINFNLGLLNLQLKQYASAFHYLKTATTLSGGLSIVYSLLAVCLYYLEDIKNSELIHKKAIEKSKEDLLPLPILNFCVFLYNNDEVNKNETNKDSINKLLMDFEQSWLKRKKNSSDFDYETMNVANQLCKKLNLNSHMAWNKETTE